MARRQIHLIPFCGPTLDVEMRIIAMPLHVEPYLHAPIGAAFPDCLVEKLEAAWIGPLHAAMPEQSSMLSRALSTLV